MTLAETEWNLAQRAIHVWKSQRALLHAEHALERALLTGLKELTARCLYTLGLSYAFGGHWKEVVAYAEEARTLYAAIEDQAIDVTGLSAQLTYAGFPPSWQLTNRAMEVLCLGLLALGHINLGEPQAGVHVARVALDISLEINNVWVHAYGVLNLNHALLEVGEYEEALRVTQQGVELARTLPNPTLLFFMLTVLGAAQQAMLRLEEARTTLMESLALTDALAIRSYQVLATSRLCANQALAGDWKNAHAYALETVAVRNTIETSLLFIDFIRYHETEALLQGGDREALAYLQEAAMLANEIGLPGELWQIQVALRTMLVGSGSRGTRRLPGRWRLCRSSQRRWGMRRCARISSPNLRYGACWNGNAHNDQRFPSQTNAMGMMNTQESPFNAARGTKGVGA